jgi:hypothetical protein
MNKALSDTCILSKESLASMEVFGAIVMFFTIKMGLRVCTMDREGFK